jgi:cytochrome c1
MKMIRLRTIALASAALIGLSALAVSSAWSADEQPSPPAAKQGANEPTPATEAGEGQPSPARQSWSFSGLFGTFDQEQLQRGFKVYHDVCANCHTLSIPFRTLSDPSGPGFSDAQVKALAATYTVTETQPNDKG